MIIHVCIRHRSIFFFPNRDWTDMEPCALQSAKNTQRRVVLNEQRGRQQELTGLFSCFFVILLVYQ